ncbi:WD40 repeat-like protein, partial [Dendrothele bispora CBS 962.96]
CMEGTRVKLLQDLEKWAISIDKHGISWIFGIAGTGKSAVAVSLASRIRNCLDDNISLALTFHCVKGQETSRPSLLVPTICYQLARISSKYGDFLFEMLEKDDVSLNVPDLPLSEQLNKFLNPTIFKKLMNKRIIIMIDGLDEWGTKTERETLLKGLINFCNEINMLKVVITSRPHQDIEEALESSSVSKFNITKGYYDASSDIKLFIGSKFKSNPEITPEEINKLVQKADGLFIWVVTALIYIKNSMNEKDSLSVLLGVGPNQNKSRGPHQELYELYNMVLEEAFSEEGNCKYFKTVMKLLLAAIEPISRVKLQGLLDVEGIKPAVTEKVLKNLQAVVYEHDGKLYNHLSFGDFLISEDESRKWFIEKQDAHMMISEICINILIKELKFNICNLETSCLRNAEVINPPLEERIEKYISPQLEYSCLFWGKHLVEASEYFKMGNFQEKLRDFVTQKWLIYWLECLSLMGKLHASIDCLKNAREWAELCQNDLDIFLKEVRGLVDRSFGAIHESTPHLYVSVLPMVLGHIEYFKALQKHVKKVMRIEMQIENQSSLVKVLNCSGDIKSVAYSPDGKHIVSGCLDKTVRIWDSQIGQPVCQPLQGHTDHVWSVAYSPDGRLILSGSSDGTIRIWDALTGQPAEQPLQGHTNPVCSVAYSPDGRHMVSGSGDETVRIWDSQTGQPVGQPLQGHTDSVCSVAYSPDGRHIVSGSDDKTVRIWDSQTRQPVGQPLQGHTHNVESVAYSPDGRHIVSGSADKTVRIWDSQTGQPIGQPLQGHTDYVQSVTYSPDGRHIVSGSRDNTVRIWDSQTGQPVGQPLHGHTFPVWSVAYSPDGIHIVSGSSDKTMRIWDSQTGRPVDQPLQGHTNYVQSVAYSPDGRHIVSGSDDKTVRIWDSQTGPPVGQLLQGHTDSVWSVAYSPDGRHIVSGSQDKTVRIWDSQTGQPVGQPLQGHTDPVCSVAYSPDGRHIVSGSDDRTVKIWESQTGQPVDQPLLGHTDSVWSVAYSPDGRHIVSGSDDKTVRIWDSQTGEPVGQPLQGHTDSVWSVVYSPDGQHIVSGSKDKTVRIWDSQTGQPVGQPLQGHTDYVSSVAYSPDGRHIVSGSEDKTVRIWDSQNGQQVGQPLQGHTGSVWSVAYSPDGIHMVSGSSDKTIRIWDLQTGQSVVQPLQ